MFKEDIKACLSADRNALQQYLASDKKEALNLPRREAYCICEVLTPSVFKHISLLLRATIIWITNLLPFSGLKIFLYRLSGAKIGRGVYISPGVFIDPLYPALITIGDDVVLGIGCRLMTHEYTTTNYRIGPVTIGNGSVIGAFSTIRCGINIGEKVTVGMHSFVNKNVPDNQTVGGVPAKPLKR